MKRIANRRKRPPCPVVWLILTLAVMTGMAGIAGAAAPSTTLDVEAGFGGQFRPGRWSRDRPSERAVVGVFCISVIPHSAGFP
jgi:hypothetical protein